MASKMGWEFFLYDWTVTHPKLLDDFVEMIPTPLGIRAFLIPPLGRQTTYMVLWAVPRKSEGTSMSP